MFAFIPIGIDCPYCGKSDTVNGSVKLPLMKQDCKRCKAVCTIRPMRDLGSIQIWGCDWEPADQKLYGEAL